MSIIITENFIFKNIYDYFSSYNIFIFNIGVLMWVCMIGIGMEVNQKAMTITIQKMEEIKK
jgi:hypothetical protein